MCLITTALSSLPSNMMLFFQPSKSNFVFALVNTSLAFFLFSFQVHEKSILLVAIPVLMLLSGAREGYGRYTSAFASWMLVILHKSISLTLKNFVNHFYYGSYTNLLRVQLGFMFLWRSYQSIYSHCDIIFMHRKGVYCQLNSLQAFGLWDK